MPMAQLDLLTERAEAACDALRSAQAFFEFDDLNANNVEK